MPNAILHYLSEAFVEQGLRSCFIRSTSSDCSDIVVFLVPTFLSYYAMRRLSFHRTLLSVSVAKLKSYIYNIYNTLYNLS